MRTPIHIHRKLIRCVMATMTQWLRVGISRKNFHVIRRAINFILIEMRMNTLELKLSLSLYAPHTPVQPNIRHKWESSSERKKIQ